MIPFIKPYFDNDDVQAIQEVLLSGWVAQGPKVEELETAVAQYLGCKHVISVTNCTTALTLALMALGIGKEDEVIVPDFTFPATAIAVTNVGAKPVLVDVGMGTYNTNAEKIEASITNKTKAIIPVHLFGLGCDMEQIMEVAYAYKLHVIEDAACSLGAVDDRGTKLGTIGNIGCFSLHASKGITTGEGGLICTNDEGWAFRLRRLAVFGDERAYRRSMSGVPFHFDPLAGNYKMSDITAALALSQLKKIDKLIDWRIKVAEEWRNIIVNDDFLTDNISLIPYHVDDHTHIYQSYVAVCKEDRRPKVMSYMKEKGFQCGIGTHACHRYKAFPLSGDMCSNSGYLYDHAISFPRYYGLSPLEEWNKNK